MYIHFQTPKYMKSLTNPSNLCTSTPIYIGSVYLHLIPIVLQYIAKPMKLFNFLYTRVGAFHIHLKYSFSDMCGNPKIRLFQKKPKYTKRKIIKFFSVVQ